MNRRTALVSSAVVSVAVLGGAVAAAAVSGVGVLGFGSTSSTGGPTAVASPSAVQPDVVDTAVGPVADSGVRVRIIEDRVVIETSTGADSDDIARSAVEAAIRSRSGSGGVESGDGDNVSSSLPPAVSPPSTSVHYDDHDEFEHGGEQEYEEYEHAEEHEGHDEYEESHHD